MPRIRPFPYPRFWLALIALLVATVALLRPLIPRREAPSLIAQAVQWRRRAQSAMAQGHYTAAVGCYNRALRLYQQGWHKAWQRAGGIPEIPSDPFWQAKFDSTDEALRESSRIDHAMAETWYERGLANYKAGNVSDAISDFDHALRLGPRAAYYRAQAQAYRLIGQHDKAKKDDLMAQYTTDE